MSAPKTTMTGLGLDGDPPHPAFARLPVGRSRGGESRSRLSQPRQVARPLHPTFRRRESSLLLRDTESTFEFLPRTRATSSARDGLLRAPPPGPAAVRKAPMEFLTGERSPPRSPAKPRPPRGVTHDVTTEVPARTPLPTGSRGKRVARRMTRIYADPKDREAESVEGGSL